MSERVVCDAAGSTVESGRSPRIGTLILRRARLSGLQHTNLNMPDWESKSSRIFQTDILSRI